MAIPPSLLTEMLQSLNKLWEVSPIIHVPMDTGYMESALELAPPLVFGVDHPHRVLVRDDYNYYKFMCTL